MSKPAHPMAPSSAEVKKIINELQERAYLPSFTPIIRLNLAMNTGEFPILSLDMYLPEDPKASWEDVIRLAKLVPNPTWPDMLKLAAELNLPEETKE